MGYQTLNYNASSFVNNTRPEIDYIHYTLIGGNEKSIEKSDTKIIWFIEDMKSGDKFEHNLNLMGDPSTILGRGMFMDGEGMNTCFINNNFHMNPYTYRPRTIPHELGHAMYSLFHPNDFGGVKYDGLISEVKSDKYNIMNSGALYDCCTKKNIDEYRIRKYQWKFIREGK